MKIIIIRNKKLKLLKNGKILFYSIFLMFSTSLFSQNRINNTEPSSLISKNEQWELDKVVWSHSYYRKGSKDKPVIDYDAIDNWISLGEYLAISSDGQYFSYSVLNHEKRRLDTLIIQSSNKHWRRALVGIQPGFFTRDSKQYIYQDGNDLCFLILGTGEVKRIKDVTSMQRSSEDNSKWVAYKAKNNEVVVLTNLLTGEINNFKNVDYFSFDKSNKWFSCKKTSPLNELIIYNISNGNITTYRGVDEFIYSTDGEKLLLKNDSCLRYVVPAKDMEVIVWSISDANAILDSYSFSNDGNRVVFALKDSKKDDGNKNALQSIWVWRQGMIKPIMKANNYTAGIDSEYVVSGPVSLPDNGEFVKFFLKPKQVPAKAKPFTSVALDVWSYNDTILQCTQPYLLSKPILYAAVIPIEGSKVIQLESKNVNLRMLKGNYAIVYKSGKVMFGDRFWEKGYNSCIDWLVDLQTGVRRYLVTANVYAEHIWLSPTGKYLIYFDAYKSGHYFSYDFKNNRVTDITVNAPLNQFTYSRHYLVGKQDLNAPIGVAHWLGEELLVYSEYDIWKLDPTGRNLPENITNGYGNAHKILFSLMNSDRGEIRSGDSAFAINDTLLLRAFSRKNKYNGFFKKILSDRGNPQVLFMGPYYMDHLAGTNKLSDGMHPLKALDVNVWIVKRETATEAPNYYITNDLEYYKQLTYLQPHAKYNWLTTELHPFKQLDGMMSQGVLYKPENFNPQIKYPVIISFYGDLSDRLYQYPNPKYIDAPHLYDNPAWMVSHGYLVFTPDIYFTKNKWGPSTLNTIDGAARYLSALPYVDKKSMGAVGHSNSGRFGYYLFTHSKLFAAMSIGSGFTGTDVISLALSLNYPSGKVSNLEVAENSAFGTGLGNIWENKDSWIDHTAVLQADKSKSPLLLYHDKKDGDDPRAAVELYTALRRLEKSCWWLSYDNGKHGVSGRDAQDFTIRYTQFFDHYLKRAPAPSWMCKGVPYALKGIESRLELLPSGSCGKSCVICSSLKK